MWVAHESKDSHPAKTHIDEGHVEREGSSMNWEADTDHCGHK